MSITQRLNEVRATLREGVTLLAVSKYHPEAELVEAYEAGQRDFGENLAQEMLRKHACLPADIRWHFIGHLQKNKVKMIAPFVSLIHAVDSIALLQEIDKQAQRAGRTIDCLLQIHIAQEETKFGLSPDECRRLLDEGTWRTLTGTRIVGLMCMASNTDDLAQVRREFESVNRLFLELKARHFANDAAFCVRSWGMSGDYPVAIESGSNLVRVGSLIFGERPPKENLNTPLI